MSGPALFGEDRADMTGYPPVSTGPKNFSTTAQAVSFFALMLRWAVSFSPLFLFGAALACTGLGLGNDAPPASEISLSENGVAAFVFGEPLPDRLTVLPSGREGLGVCQLNSGVQVSLYDAPTDGLSFGGHAIERLLVATVRDRVLGVIVVTTEEAFPAMRSRLEREYGSITESSRTRAEERAEPTRTCPLACAFFGSGRSSSGPLATHD